MAQDTEIEVLVVGKEGAYAAQIQHRAMFDGEQGFEFKTALGKTEDEAVERVADIVRTLGFKFDRITRIVNPIPFRAPKEIGS